MKISTRNIVILALLCQPLYVLASADCCVKNTSYTSNDLVSSILYGLVAAVISAIISLIALRATRFNDSVTKARSSYIEEFRQMAAAFLTSVIEDEEPKDSNQTSECEHDEKPARYYYYRLLLMLNPTKPGSYWENDMIERMTNLVTDPSHKITDKEVRDLVALLQSDLDLEWHGMMEEGKRGKLSESDKDKLRMEYYLNFKKYIR